MTYSGHAKFKIGMPTIIDKKALRLAQKEFKA